MRLLDRNALLCAACLFGLASAARADFEISIAIDGNTISSMDQNGKITGAGTGSNGPNTANLTVAGSTGIVSVSGDSSWPNAFLDLGDLIDITNKGTAAHTYTVTLTEDSFTNPENGTVILVGGVPVTGAFSGYLGAHPNPADTAVYQAFADPNNAFYGTTITSGAQTDSNGGSTWDPEIGTSGVFSATNPYSMTATFSVYLNGGDIFSADGFSYIEPVPAPSTAVFALTGLPLLGLGFWVRRRRVRKAPVAA